MQGDVIDEQLRLATLAGMDVLISSWWGPRDYTDVALQHIMEHSAGTDSPQPDMRFAVYYEAEGQGDPSVEEIVSDLEYLESSLFSRQNYLRIDDKPVLFVYADANDGSAMTRRWAEARASFRSDIFLVLKVYPGYRDDPNQPNSWHQYSPAEPTAETKGSFSISPGFWKAGEAPRLQRDPSRFEQSVAEMLGSNAEFFLITTWNEWGEGSAVEPSKEFGSVYLDILCRHLNSNPAACESLESRGPDEVAPILVGAGDIADCKTSAAETAAIIQHERGESPDITVMAVGDTAYESGTQDEFKRCYEPTWGAFKDITHPAVGNHEYNTAGAAGYFDYFGSAAGNRGEGYYSYDLGSWHIVVLNSNCDQVSCAVGSPQESWLRQDLALHPAACTLAYWHHPLFSSGEHGNNPEVGPLWQALEDAGAELVVSGHDHNYERFAPQTSDGIGDPEAGIVQFVIGTGGKTLRDVGNPEANSEVVVRQVHGVLELTLHSDSYTWRFVATDGSFLDSGSSRCH